MHHKTALWLLLLLVPASVHARCDNTAPLYQHFKNYRNLINNTDQIDSVKVFFTKRFTQYYEDKLVGNLGKSDKQRYLTQYWDNLRTARDIIIVYDYSVFCVKQNPTLRLTAVLKSNNSKTKPTVDLWNIDIYYMWENNRWLINQFEYTKSESNLSLPASAIKDNFLMLK